MEQKGSALVCSMTRANKLLAQLREGSSSSVTRTRRSRYLMPTTATYHKEVNLLYYTDAAQLAAQLNGIRAEFNSKLLKKKLVEKWKNRLFELNIRYGLHSLLSKIELLQQEKTMCTELLQSLIDNNCVTAESAKVSMDAVRTSEKKYDFKWNVGAFEQDVVKSRLQEISKELSNLDEMKDKLNIENSFSIDLTDEERAMLNI